MKKILIALMLCVPLMVNAAPTKKFCIDKKDKYGNVIKDKSGKPVQKCRWMKVHKKVENPTKVPSKTK